MNKHAVMDMCRKNIYFMQVEILAAEVAGMTESMNPDNPLETFTANEISGMQGGCFVLTQ